MKNKKTIIALSVSTMMLTACGGGGGASQPTVNGTKPIFNTDSHIIKDNTQAKKSSQYLDNAKKDKNDSMKGKGTKVLVVDYGVDTNDKEIKKSNVSKNMYVYDKNSNSPSNNFIEVPAKEFNIHGTHMNKIVSKNTPEATIYNYGIDSSHKKAGSILTAFKGAAYITEKEQIDVVNNSYGTNTYGVHDFSKFSQGVEDVIDNGALFVISTGNDNEKNPNDAALLPKFNKKLKDGVIAVTGIEDGEQMYNKCGEIKNDCIAAPSLNTINNADDTISVISGTSPSSAYVTSVASNVKSRYDWMKGKELKDVLISTAIDRGEKGNDEVWGVGEINQDKALNGYGFINNETLVNVNGKKDIYYFDNDIYGNGSFIKDGSKSLVLNGNNTFTGKNKVINGELILNGKNLASTEIHKNGKLSVGDNKSISSGTIVNNGTLESNTTTDLHINGDFISNKDSNINKAIGSTIIVEKTANIDKSNLNIIGIAPYYITKNGKEEKLITANNIVGKFNQINIDNVNDLIAGQINVDKQKVSLITKREEVGVAAKKQSDYKGKEVAVKNIEKVLNKYDEDFEKNGYLNDEQAKMASKIIQRKSLNKILFDLGTETDKHAQENALIFKNNHNLSFIKNLKSKENNVWLNYGYGESKLNVKGLSGNSNDNTITLGFSYPIKNQAISVALNKNDYRWKENYEDLSKNIRIDGYGFDFGYNYNFKNYNLYSIAGFSSLNHKNNYDEAKSLHHNLGLGVSKSFYVKNLEIIPHLNLQYLKSKVKDFNTQEYIGISGLNTKYIVSNFEIDGLYKINDKFNVTTNIGLSKDLNKKTSYKTSYTNIDLENKFKNQHISEIRYKFGLGFIYSPTNKTKINFNVNHNNSVIWKQNSLNFGLSHKF